jgi:hypothetical protein
VTDDGARRRTYDGDADFLGLASRHSDPASGAAHPSEEEHRMPVSSRRFTLAVAAAATAFATMAGPAMASGPAGSCPGSALSNPFAQWGDNADYQLAPEGDVESGGATWSTVGGAGAAEGNQTAVVLDPSDHQSMSLPAGSSASMAPMCLGTEHPSFRFFVRRIGGSTISRLLVEVVARDSRGRQWALPSRLVVGSNSWAPSLAMPTRIELLGLLFGETVDVSFRFTPVAGGTWSVDDVYVDPWKIG